MFLRGNSTADALAVAEQRSILAANEAAQRLGIRAGLGVPTACALAPELAVRNRNPRAEGEALDEIAAWAGQFTPNVSLDASDCVLLEVAASLRLFGGTHSLIRRLASGCAALGFRVVIAGAPTPLAARLLCRAGSDAVIREPAELASALSPLPVPLLDCAPRVLETLAAVGARTIGDCLRLPRAGLARRCGAGLVAVLDAALGRVPDPRRWFVPPQKFSARLELLSPVEQTEAVLFAARRLLAGLAGFLAARQSGIERFRLRLGHEEVPATLLTLSLAGRSRDENRFLTVLRERLSALQLVAPVASVGIEADEIQALAPSSRTLFGDAAEQRESCALLLERLRARLGQEAVLGVRAVPAHRPEFAWRETEPGARQRLESICGARPLWLLDPPQHLAARNGAPAWGGLLTLLAGPERIESGWWDGMDAARDYFIAAGTEGELLWLFRERRAPHGWYLHGLFA